MKISTSKPRNPLAATAAFLTGSAAVAILASGCASHSGAQGGQSMGYQTRKAPYDSSSRTKAEDSSHSSSGYGGSGTGTGGAGFDPSIAGDSTRSYYDTIRDPYHYPGTAIPGVPGQGGSGGIPGTDTTHNVTPPKMPGTPPREPDSAGSEDFIERG